MSKNRPLWPFTVMGYVIRAMQVLPYSWREKLMHKIVNKEAAELPSFHGMVRFLEAAGNSSLIGVGHKGLVLEYPELDSVSVTCVDIPGPHGIVKAKLYKGRTSRGASGFVWVHGGAFVGGNIDGTEAHWAGLALAAAGIPVLSLSYRKALRGIQFPVPSDDVLAGWNWANSNLSRFGEHVNHLHLGGASAGGNLTAGVCKRLRDGAGKLPSSLLLIYPLLHVTLPDEPPGTLNAIQKRAPGAYFSQPWIDDCMLNYAGSPAMLSDPYAVPAMGSVGNQPPVLIVNCEVDSLRVSGEDYARRLLKAGVTVQVETLKDALHGCIGDPTAIGGVQCLSLMRDWLIAH